jgi:hypothetical protein
VFLYDIGLTIKPYDFFSLEVVHFSSDVTNLIQWKAKKDRQR